MIRGKWSKYYHKVSYCFVSFCAEPSEAAVENVFFKYLQKIIILEHGGHFGIPTASL